MVRALAEYLPVATLACFLGVPALPARHGLSRAVHGRGGERVLRVRGWVAWVPLTWVGLLGLTLATCLLQSSGWPARTPTMDWTTFTPLAPPALPLPTRLLQATTLLCAIPAFLSPWVWLSLSLERGSVRLARTRWELAALLVGWFAAWLLWASDLPMTRWLLY